MSTILPAENFEKEAIVTEDELKKEIESYIAGNYSLWLIGVTDRPMERKGEYGNPRQWHQWDASTGDLARRVESYFLERGCMGGLGGNSSAKYVYIF